MARITQRGVWGAVAVLVLIGPAWANYPTGYDQRYVDAVNDAKQPTLTPDKVDNHLTTINTTGPVLMSCFTDFSGYLTRAYDGTGANWRPKVWCAATPEMWQFYQTNNTAPQDMSLRTKQLLGLPANHSAYFVMEFYVNSTSLFRPAMDPSITNPVTATTFPSYMKPGNYYYDWFQSNFSTYQPHMSHGVEVPPYPWLRTGYTYDWGSADPQHVGLTEFIADSQNLNPDPTDPTQIYQRNPIWVRSVISLISYKYYVRDSDSFDVTGACDTLWVGSQYLPVTPGGNWVNIHSGVTVSGGEGVTVSDLDGQPSNVVITNAGTIQGPSKDHFGNPHPSSVWFTNTGGTLNNSGTITGNQVGVLGSDACTRPIVINNTGTIGGNSLAIHTGGGDDLITTGGRILGGINTGPGNDTIFVTGGAINGSIDGGTGTNTLNFTLPQDVTFALEYDIFNMAAVNVQGGTVRLDGTVYGPVTVWPGATLGGIGAINNSLVNHGTLSPGDSIGTLTVRDNYTQGPGNWYVAEVAKPADSTLLSDHLNVGGTATLAQASIVYVRLGGPNGSVFRDGDTFHVLGAGSLVNQGAVLISDSAFLGLTPLVTATDFGFRLTRTATFAALAAPGNNAAMAAALDADAAGAPSDGYAGLIDQLLFGSGTALNNSLVQFSPAPYFAAEAATDRTAQYMAEDLSLYLRGRRAGQSCPPCDQVSESSYRGSLAFAQAVGSPTELAGVVRPCADGRGTIAESQGGPCARCVWVDPFGVFFGEKSLGDHLGFQANAAGVQLGVDSQPADGCIVGIGGGYDQTHLDTANLSSVGTVDSFRVGPYVTCFDDGWFSDASLTGGFHQNDLGRTVGLGGADETAHGQYSADDLSFYLDGGRDYRWQSYTFSPLVSLQYIYYHQNAFDESGGDGADLAVDPRNDSSLRSRLGAQVTRLGHWGAVKVLPELYAGWAHEYLADTAMEARFLGGSTPFWTDRGGVFRDAGYFGAGLTVMPRNRLALFTRYNGEFSDGGHFNAVDLGAVIEF